MRSGCTVSQVTGYMLIIVISLLYWKTRRVGEKGHNTGNSGDFNMKTEHEFQRKRGLKTKNADSPSRKNFKKKSLPTFDELEGSVSTDYLFCFVPSGGYPYDLRNVFLSSIGCPDNPPMQNLYARCRSLSSKACDASCMIFSAV